MLARSSCSSFVMDVFLNFILGNCVVEEIVSNSKRFNYDPRALNDRHSKPLKELNIDELREACNGCAGVLCYLPAEPNPDYQELDVSDCSVAREVVVTQEETIQFATPALPPSLTDLAESISDADEY